jgi:hypothetical protein
MMIVRKSFLLFLFRALEPWDWRLLTRWKVRYSVSQALSEAGIRVVVTKISRERLSRGFFLLRIWGRAGLRIFNACRTSDQK